MNKTTHWTLPEKCLIPTRKALEPPSYLSSCNLDTVTQESPQPSYLSNSTSPDGSSLNRSSDSNSSNRSMSVSLEPTPFDHTMVTLKDLANRTKTGDEEEVFSTKKVVNLPASKQ